jgi:hypothetical protein
MKKLLVIAVCCSSLLAQAASATTPVKFDPTNFVPRVTNPWFPLKPGTTWIYRGVKDGKQTRNVVTVTSRTKTIVGVRATEVHDLLYEAGHLEERTSDWYAQDKQGNVWYLGEDTAELDQNGHVKTREGSWLTGRNGAQAGIFMPKTPRVGFSARQEFYKGQAEDYFQVLSLESTVRVPYLASHKALLTKEWTPLEPAVLDHKYYVRGIGNVKEISVKGPLERNVLVAVRR